MNTAFLIQLFVALVVAGLFLVGAEVFVPGGVLGIIGALALIAATVIAFPAFGPAGGLITAVALIILTGVAIFLWVKIFPRTRLGKHMTVSMDLHDSKATEDDLPALLGKTGEAISDLRPSGYVLIEGRRTDVVTQGEMISKGEKVNVIEIDGNRVVVARNM